MTDKLIASGLAALARENQRRIPVFAFPKPRSRPARRLLTRPYVVAAAPTLTTIAVGLALLAFRASSFGHYEPFVLPFVVAVASLVGLAVTSAPDPTTAKGARLQVTYVLTGGALVIATIVYLVFDWPTPGTLAFDTGGDSLYAIFGGSGSRFVESPGFMVIAATLAVVSSRLIAAQTKLAWANRGALEAWGTGALIVSVLVVVVWTNAFNFEGHGWTLASFRLPDPTIRHHLAPFISAKMWFALRFRPFSESSVSDAQWDLATAAAVIVVVAVSTGIAIAREHRVRNRSIWLWFLERPVMLPLFIIVGTTNLLRASVGDGPRDAARPFAWAVAGVMLAFTSMILRRRRRSAASSSSRTSAISEG